MTSFSTLYALDKRFSGIGINHENQEFRGSLNCTPVAGGKGLRIEFRAVGEDDTVFHDETSLLGPSVEGVPCLFVLSSNHPGVIPHALKREEESGQSHSYVFGFGDVNNVNAFREEIILTLNSDASVEYTYFWGMPGGDFKRRSGLKMFASK